MLLLWGAQWEERGWSSGFKVSGDAGANIYEGMTSDVTGGEQGGETRTALFPLPMRSLALRQSPVPALSAQRPSPRCAAVCRTGTQHGPAGSRPGTGLSRGQTAAGPGSGQRGESAFRPSLEGQRVFEAL